MSETVKTVTMSKSDIEAYLSATYGNKIAPVKGKAKRSGMNGFYEQMHRPHRYVHKTKDGRVKIKDIDGTIRWE